MSLKITVSRLGLCASVAALISAGGLSLSSPVRADAHSDLETRVCTLLGPVGDTGYTLCDYVHDHPDAVSIPAQPFIAPSNMTTYFLINTQTLAFNTPTQTVTTVNAFQTTIQGKLIGGSLLYDQTFPDAYGSAPVQAGLSQARLAITTAGGPGVVIAAPQLISHSVTSSSTTTSTYSLNHIVVGETPVTQEYVGGTGNITTVSPTTGLSEQPDPIYGGVETVETKDANGNWVNITTPVMVGTLSDCSGAVTAQPSTTRPVCTTLPGDRVHFGPGADAYVTSYNDTYFVDESDAVTTTTLTSETYLVLGTVRPLGTVHVMAPVAIFEDAEGLMGRLSATSDGNGPWLEAWGSEARTGSDGDLPGSRRQSRGIRGGLQGQLSSHVRVGVSVNSGTTDLSLTSVGESGRVVISEFAVYGAFTSGPWFADLSGGRGQGRVDAFVSPIGTEQASGSYRRFSLTFAGLHAGLHLPLGAGTISPEIGATHAKADMAAFAESGSDFALRGDDAGYKRDTVFVGAAMHYPLTHALSLDGVVRVANRSGDLSPTLPVVFAAYGPDSPTLNIQAPHDTATAGEVGASATWQLGPHAEAYLGYDVVASRRTTNQTARIGLRIRL